MEFSFAKVSRSIKLNRAQLHFGELRYGKKELLRRVNGNSWPRNSACELVI
jgi:phosphatidate phosphatase PAH1